MTHVYIIFSIRQHVYPSHARVCTGKNGPIPTAVYSSVVYSINWCSVNSQVLCWWRPQLKGQLITLSPSGGEYSSPQRNHQYIVIVLVHMAPTTKRANWDYIILLILSSFFTGYPHNPYNGVVCNDTITATGVFSSKQLWRLAKGTYYNYLVNGSVNDQSVIIAKLLTFELNKHIQGHPYYYHQIYFLTLYF